MYAFILKSERFELILIGHCIICVIPSTKNGCLDPRSESYLLFVILKKIVDTI